jgi:hypothetical protein
MGQMEKKAVERKIYMRIIAWGGIVLGFLLVLTGITLQRQVKGHFLESRAMGHQNPGFYRRMQGQALYFLALFTWIPSLRVIRNMETSPVQFIVLLCIGLMVFGFFQLIIAFTNKREE